MQDVLRYFPGLMAGAHDYLAELGRTARQAFSPTHDMDAADEVRQKILKLVELERKRARSNTNCADGEFMGNGV